MLERTPTSMYACAEKEAKPRVEKSWTEATRQLYMLYCNSLLKTALYGSFEKLSRDVMGPQNSLMM